MEEIKNGIVNENEKSRNGGGGAEAKSAFLTEIRPLIQALVKITERYANPAEGEKKHVAIAVMATDQDAEVNTAAVCGTGENLFKGLCEFAISDRTTEKIYMKAAAHVAASKITGIITGEIAKA